MGSWLSQLFCTDAAVQCGLKERIFKGVYSILLLTLNRLNLFFVTLLIILETTPSARVP